MKKIFTILCLMFIVAILASCINRNATVTETQDTDTTIVVDQVADSLIILDVKAYPTFDAEAATVTK